MPIPVFSFIIPTYNSGQHLASTLKSIREQLYNQDLIEIMVIDGGSADNTIDIANEFGCKVINNPYRLPEYAKQIGFLNATGHYAVEMDSDECFSTPDTLLNRFCALRKNCDVHILVADSLSSDNKHAATSYINHCGDPFSFFMYRNKRYITETYHDNIKSRDKLAVVFDFTGSAKRPIADGGTTTIDIEYVKRKFPDKLNDIRFCCSISDNVMNVDNSCICIPGETIIHNPRASFKTYFKKIKFRVINNVLHSSESGFSSRAISRANIKKYFFPLYVLLIFPIFFDSIYLSVKYRDKNMMMHFIYGFYTCFLIGYYYMLKIAGKTKDNTEY